jgi:hypothetical protein
MPEREFYLGRRFDPASGKVTAEDVNYNPDDLTTHAFVTGMTGSGKTGLCVALLEEAALQGVPAILIDPKGDLTNLLLHFPDMAPQDFQPWLDPEIARREGKTLEQMATETAMQWRTGLMEWGINRERLLALKSAVQYAIYTPGSDAGIPVSVLSSLAVPDLPWETNREILREKISSTVTALLGLVGMDEVDPIRSREHILLSNIFENAWSQGKSLDLTELILQTQTPPFDKLGAFPVQTFFPDKDRMDLAMQLNNILAAPAFESWREGQALDVQDLLFTPEGKPRHSVFYIAHLSDAERMFFVTLLLTAVETWMRSQAGSTSLRALLYMDEIYGYLPPTRNPSSKQPLLRMLKQARAFGLGLLLATQNPVDMDYKALSNAGTWFVGKLQTDQDKQRLLDGLESAAGGLPRAAYDQIISKLGKRVFLLHNVHEKQPVLLQTRWAMNYLAGPLTRMQIAPLNKLAGAALQAEPAGAGGFPPMTGSAPASRPEPATPVAVPVSAGAPASRPAAAAPRPSTGATQTRPALPAGVAEYFLPMNYSLPEAYKVAGQPMPAQALAQEVLYRPALVASGSVRFLDRKFGVDSQLVKNMLAVVPDRRGVIRWEEVSYGGRLDKMETAPAPNARFDVVDAPLNDAKRMTALQKDFSDWLYRSCSVKARANETLKVYGGPDVTQAEFMKACADAARDGRDAEMAKAAGVIERKIATLKDRLAREERELHQDEAELSSRKWEEGATHAENVIGLFTGRGSVRKVSSSLTKRRMTEQAKADVDESVDAIKQMQDEIAELEKQRAGIETEVNARWGDVVNQISEVTVNPKKTDIFVDVFGVAWVPYYQVQAGGQTVELPAFGPE